MEGNQKGLVVFHAKSLLLSDVRFIVGEKGRQRVLKERQKNVHAYVEGNLESIELYKGINTNYPFYKTFKFPCINKGKQVSYNPYKLPYFFYVDDTSEITRSTVCVLNEHGLWC